ncbi:MAG: hypothetical protein HY825_00650 [Acidobacteria bacterium]|nr:hypothetical protein [Acidobacteriota bacterium]
MRSRIGTPKPRRGAAASIVFGLTLALVLAASPALAQSQPTVVHPDTVGTSTPTVVNVDLRTLPPPPEWRPGMPVRDNPRRSTRVPTAKVPEPGPHTDGLLARQESVASILNDAFAPADRNFDAFPYQGVNPPDPVGDVGPNHYITASNSSGSSVIRIYDKASPTPAVLATTTMSAIAGGTGVCASGYGDPIVLHDQWADRWLLAEFASSGNTLCIYMSQAADPVSGGWYIYQLTTPSFPDYPKFAVWPNADNLYTLTTNESSSANYALNRAAMLAGSAMTYQRFAVTDLSGFGFQALTPADVDGATAPAAATPALIGRHIDNEVHSGFAGAGDYLQLWALDVDWATPANSTFTALPLIQTSEFDSSLCGLTSFYCMAKPGVPQNTSGAALDPLREVIMWRMAYRNFGAYETLVGNLVTDVDGANRGGVRWFELRNTGGAGWTLFQEGTYSPDVAGDPANVNRWMGSAAMDGAGNIAVAYSASAFTSVYPSLRYAGRRAACDPTGTLPLGEHSIIAAAANNGSNRWGDYHSINLDPADDCTFWFAGMYGGPTSGQWTTRVASFKFPNCGCTIPGTPTIDTATATGPNQIQVTWSAGAPAAASYKVMRAQGTCAAPTTPYTEIAAGVTGTSYSDNTVSGGVTYSYKLIAVAADGCEACESGCVEATATGTCLLPPTFAGAASASSPGAATCQITVAWNAGTATCSGPLTYNVYRSTTTGFTPSAGNRVGTGLVGTSYTDLDPLTPGTRYYYVVRAVDSSNGVEETNLVEKSAIPAGPAVLTEEFETGAAGWTTVTMSGTANLWALVTTAYNSATHSEFCADIGSTSANALISPVIAPVAGSVLTFWHRFTTESGWDGGRLEVSTDGGGTWAQVPGSAFLSGGYNGTTSGTYGNPIPGAAWTGTGGSGNNFLEVRVDMTAYAGSNVRVRWALGTDSSVTGDGWWVDSVSLTGACVPTPVELLNLSIQ